MTTSTNHYLSWIDADNKLYCEFLHPESNILLIGRSEHADIEVLNSSVSRQHLELSWDNGHLKIKDLKSSYGTWVDNVVLPANESIQLNSDSEIRLGNLSMWYELRQENESQEMLQTCFHPPTVDSNSELSTEINNFRVKLQMLLKDNFGDNTYNIQLIQNIDKELLNLINIQERRLSEQRILNSISHILNRGLSESELLKTALNLVSKVLNAQRGFVVFIDPITKKHKFLAVRYFENLSWTAPENEKQQYSQNLIKQCFENNKVIVLGNTQLNSKVNDLDSVENGAGLSLAVIPLVQESQVIAVIYLDNQTQADNFNQQQVPFLTTFAAHTSIALHNSILYKRAITDDLTQLYTRQHIDERLGEEIKAVQDTNKDLSLMILDLDHFKRVNDNYGHTTGDLVLQRFSALIRKHLRDADVAGRFGGEEFIIILKDTNLNASKNIAEKIRIAVENEAIIKDHQSHQVTVSIGIASYKNSYRNNSLLLLEDADKALYQAKNQGRNQTVCFS
jgi:diguanylate cyclase (GGDEF)-like protein